MLGHIYIVQSHIAIGSLTYFSLAYKTRPREQTTPQKHISWFNTRQVAHITYATLNKHLVLLFSASLQLCIYIT